jgi:small subunit ribosomal protein S17
MTETAKSIRTITGTVTSIKMDKTVVILVERKVPDPVYGKIVKKRTKYYVHDEKNTCKLGDKISFKECRPLSKTKHWELVDVVERAVVVD